MSDSVWPHRRQLTRLCGPWDSPGKSTGVVAISFSNTWKWKVKVKLLSRVWLFATPWTAAHQAPLSMGFSRQEYWSGVPLPSPAICNYTGVKCLVAAVQRLGGGTEVYCCKIVLSYRKWQTYFMVDFKRFSSVQSLSCVQLCDPMNRSTPGLPVHHQLPEFTQTHIHRVGDAIQPSHPLSSPSPPAPNPSQHQNLFQWVNSSHKVAKVLEFQL